MTRDGEGDRPATECDCPDCNCRVASWVWLPFRPRKFFWLVHKEHLLLHMELPSRFFFFWVTVIESLARTPASIAHSSDTTCEQLSPRPAIQSQCAVIIVPFSSAQNGVSGFWLIFCEWLTYMKTSNAHTVNISCLFYLCNYKSVGTSLLH